MPLPPQESEHETAPDSDESRQQEIDSRSLAIEMAHEFRSPLHNILNLLAVLQTRVGKSGELHEIAQRAVEEVMRAKRQMDNVLTTGGVIKIARRQCSLGSIITAAARQYEARAGRRGIRLIVWDSAKHLTPLSVDAERMHQVAVNLLDNAVKYSFRNELINITGKNRAHSTSFTVTGRGIGIPKSEMQNIFHEFRREVVLDRTRLIPGIGVGLKIVQQIVKAHGGSIYVSSNPFMDDPKRQAPEHGHEVSFTVTLPRKGE